MAVCEFENRPEIRWRKNYAKGAALSHKQRTKYLLKAWCSYDVPKVPNTLGDHLLQISRKVYANLIDREFSRLSEEWKDATMHWSSVTRMVAHPNYLRIIGLASISKEHIERLILQELRDEPDHWFEALTAITGENPVRLEYDFDEAVNAWLNWGEQRGII